MKKDNAGPIKGIVEGVLEDWKKNKAFKKDILEEAWLKAAGRKASAHSRVSAFHGGRLTVEVDESGWMYQLTMKKNEILEKLNRTLKKSDIALKEIHFRIGNPGQGDVNGEERKKE